MNKHLQKIYEDIGKHYHKFGAYACEDNYVIIPINGNDENNLIAKIKGSLVHMHISSIVGQKQLTSRRIYPDKETGYYSIMDAVKVLELGLKQAGNR